MSPRVAGVVCLGEMGMLNYVVDAMAQRRELGIVMFDLQKIGGYHCAEELDEDCAGNDWHFPKTIPRLQLAHFSGRKPFLFDRQVYSRPFTIACLGHHRRQHLALGAWRVVLNEEHVSAGKFQRRFERAVCKWAHRTKVALR